MTSNQRKNEIIENRRDWRNDGVFMCLSGGLQDDRHNTC